MAKCIDLTGRRFGRLTVRSRDTSGNGVYWLCDCECGGTKSVRADGLTSGATKSCGCLRSELRVENLIGKKFSRLVVVERVQKPNDRKTERHAYWKCLCDCGNIHIVRSSDLKSGNVQSCGCYAIDQSTKHGLRDDPVYSLWCNIKARCYNPNDDSYHNYGGRGITMCQQWLDDVESFYNYVSALPHYKEGGYSIDRIDNDGNYEPGNVKWSTDKEQANNRRINHLITYNGETKTIAQWAEEIGMNQYTLYNRMLTYHWTVERALTEPVKKHK